jgi:hypothetical protein
VREDNQMVENLDIYVEEVNSECPVGREDGIGQDRMGWDRRGGDRIV